MTPKYIHKIFIPQKIFIFLKAPKILIFKSLNPKKWPEPTYVWKYQSIPPWGPVTPNVGIFLIATREWQLVESFIWKLIHVALLILVYGSDCTTYFWTLKIVAHSSLQHMIQITIKVHKIGRMQKYTVPVLRFTFKNQDMKILESQFNVLMASLFAVLLADSTRLNSTVALSERLVFSRLTWWLYMPDTYIFFKKNPANVLNTFYLFNSDFC